MISLIIPTLRIGDKLNQCINSLQSQVDEVIVIDDKIDNLATKINKGLKQAKGDYIAVSNDDIVWGMGKLRHLCIPGQVVSPRVIGGIDKLFHAHFWVMPKEIYQRAVGTIEGDSDYGLPGWYEGYDKVYYDDSDYHMKLRANGYVPVKKDDVTVIHDHPGHTLRTLNLGGVESVNRSIFIRRWGTDALRIAECG